jgi:hypothetical protein
MHKIGIALIVLVLMIMICCIDGQAQSPNDDQDGHREPWLQWVEDTCIAPPGIVMESDTCNPSTGKGVTVWVCQTSEEVAYDVAFYTAHWYCAIDDIDRSSRYFSYLPFVIKGR